MRIAAAFVMLALIFVASPVDAQSSDLHAQSQTLYLHRAADSGPFYLNDVPEHGAYTNSGYNVLGIGLSCSTYGFCWSGSTSPAPTEDILLDSNGMVTVQVAVKTIISVFGAGTIDDGPGYGDLNVDLTIDGESWGSFSETAHQFTGDFEIFSWDIAPKSDGIPAGASVQLDVELLGVAGGAVIGLSATTGVTSITFPATNLPPLLELPGGEPEVNETLEAGPTMLAGVLGSGNQTLDLTFANATETHMLNWTHEFNNLTIEGQYNGTGNVSVAIYDGNGTESFRVAWVGNGTTLEELVGVLPGNWTIEIQAINATGLLHMSFFESGASEAVPEGEVEVSDNESPGFGLFALVGLLVIAARRRK